MKKNNIAFTFATAEVNFFGQLFIMITELLTGKIKLKKLYDEYLSENRPPRFFWDDAVSKLDLTLKTSFQKDSYIKKKINRNCQSRFWCCRWSFDMLYDIKGKTRL